VELAAKPLAIVVDVLQTSAVDHAETTEWGGDFSVAR